MQFYPLQVKALDKSTEGSTIVTFDVDKEIIEQFKFTQGQYLNIKADHKGNEIRRSYSLCSSPLDNEIKIGVREVEGGVFSTYVNHELKTGDTLQVAPPSGQFFVDIEPKTKRHIIAFAAGSGITPILSMIKTHLVLESKTTIQLFYFNKTVSSIMFKEELEALKNQHLQRFEIFHFLTQEHRALDLFNGRLSEDKLHLIMEQLCSKGSVDEVFVCGPKPMMFLIRDTLTERGIDRKNIHFELFGDPNPTKSEVNTTNYEGKMSDVLIHEGGKTFKLKMNQGQSRILDEALKASSDLPFACKGGVCCTCKAKLIKGTVDMHVNYALEEDQVNDGYILTCQAIPTSDELEIDFDG